MYDCMNHSLPLFEGRSISDKHIWMNIVCTLARIIASNCNWILYRIIFRGAHLYRAAIVFGAHTPRSHRLGCLFDANMRFKSVNCGTFGSNDKKARSAQADAHLDLACLPASTIRCALHIQCAAIRYENYVISFALWYSWLIWVLIRHCLYRWISYGANSTERVVFVLTCSRLNVFTFSSKSCT